LLTAIINKLHQRVADAHGKEVLRATRRLLMAFVLFVCAAYAGLTTFSFLQLRRAQALIGEVSAVKLGVPLAQQSVAAKLVEWCYPEIGCQREASFSNLPFAHLLQNRETRAVSLPNITRPKWWLVGAAIKVDANGNAVEKQVIVDDGKYDRSPTVVVTEGGEPRLSDPCDLPGLFRHPDYYPRQDGRTGALAVAVSPQTMPQFRRRAFALHLKCLNTWRGCKSPTDLAPDAWHDMTEDKQLRASDRAYAYTQEMCRR
jgi:hypothetical protein